MERVLKLISVAVLSLSLCGTALAQTVASLDDMAVEAAEIGDGWILTSTTDGPGYPAPWDRQDVFGGPEGASVAVWVHSLGVGLEWVTGSWGRMTAFWADHATAETGISDPIMASLLVQATDNEIEAAVSDRRCVEGADTTTSASTVACLYGSYDLRIGVIIIVEGTVNDLAGVAAADYVAGLYFAALSVQ